MDQPLNVRRVFGRATAFTALAAALATLGGCHGRTARPKPVTVGQLAAMLKNDLPPLLFDANGERTRSEYGVIPGATLLPGSRDYGLDLLPETKTRDLVFYCASSWCGAAEAAADRAARAGYTAVHVLPEGIKGWTEAGLPTQKLQHSMN